MNANTPKTKFVYLSLGDKEKATKNPRLAVVEDCTVQAVELLKSQEIPVVFKLNRGGDFQDVPVRIAHGINVLVEG